MSSCIGSPLAWAALEWSIGDRLGPARSAMYKKSTLPNGLRVVTGEMPHTRSATVSIYVGAGSRYELDPEAGLSHFLEHMLFKGASRRPTARDISEAIES